MFRGGVQRSVPGGRMACRRSWRRDSSRLASSVSSIAIKQRTVSEGVFAIAVKSSSS